eukprot:scaffold1501_cov352-Pavlova_lutheri.AAC.49
MTAGGATTSGSVRLGLEGEGAGPRMHARSRPTSVSWTTRCTGVLVDVHVFCGCKCVACGCTRVLWMYVWLVDVRVACGCTRGLWMYTWLVDVNVWLVDVHVFCGCKRVACGCKRVACGCTRVACGCTRVACGCKRVACGRGCPSGAGAARFHAVFPAPPSRPCVMAISPPA